MRVVGVFDPLLLWLYFSSKLYVMHGQYPQTHETIYITVQVKKHPSLPHYTIVASQFTDTDDSIVVDGVR